MQEAIRRTAAPEQLTECLEGEGREESPHLHARCARRECDYRIALQFTNYR